MLSLGGMLNLRTLPSEPTGQSPCLKFRYDDLLDALKEQRPRVPSVAYTVPFLRIRAREAVNREVRELVAKEVSEGDRQVVTEAFS